MGEISYKTRDNLSISKRSYGAEINLNKVYESAKMDKTYKKISKFPSISRDISIVVDKDLSHDQIEEIIEEADDECDKN